MSCFFSCQKRPKDVPQNDSSKTADTEYSQQRDAYQKENVTDFIVSP
jgi:hypothetical protein